MLWLWIKNLIRWVGIILLPIPTNLPDTRIDPESPCPACGNYGSTLMAERVKVKDREQIFIRQTCRTCQFPYYRESISIPKYPAI